MKIKSSIIAVLAIAALPGCASTQMQMVDGMEREVFKVMAGNYTKNQTTLVQFNEAHGACQKIASDEKSDASLGSVSPFDLAGQQRWALSLMDKTATCLQASGFILIDTSEAYKKTKAKLKGKI